MLKPIWIQNNAQDAETSAVSDQDSFNLSDKAVVNYVWINKEKVSPSKEDPVCGVPLHYLDKAFENAKLYPDTPFQIWLDYALLNDESRFFVESHIFYSAPENVCLRDINDLPAVQKDAGIFDESNNIWARTDLARLYVLQHCLQSEDVEYAFYSDFDVDDVLIHDKESSDRLDRHGMFFGAVKNDEGLELENGFIAFKLGKGLQLLSDELIPMAKAVAEKGGKGITAVRDFVKKWAASQGLKTDYTNALSALRLNPVGYRIDFKPEYDGVCINTDPADCSKYSP